MSILNITAETDIGLSNGKPIVEKFTNFKDANFYAKVDSKAYGRCKLTIDSDQLPNPLIYDYRDGEIHNVFGL